MSNAFFDPGAQRAVKVDQLFTRIARRYDLLNDVQSFGLHRIWKRRLVRMAGIEPGCHALDVCCGTGDISFALAKSGAEVTSLDFNEPMLAVARRKAEAWAVRKTTVRLHDAGHSSSTVRIPTTSIPRFVHGDAQQLPFEDGSFDVVTVGYGLRNLANWERGLGEMERVAKAGGRLLVLDFGKPPMLLLRRLYYGYLRGFVPMLGLIFCGSASAYAYILESLKQYPAQEGVAARMTELGLRHVRIINVLGGIMSINYGEKAKG